MKKARPMGARWIGLAALLGACATSAARRTPPVEDGVPPPAATPEATTSACPKVDYAQLEPDKHHPDSRTIELTRVFVREEARQAAVAAPAAIKLGVVRVQRTPIGQPWTGLVGMGWMGLQASWIESSLSPEVEAPLAEWEAAWEVLGDHQRGAYLLDTHLRYARSVGVPEAWSELRCLKEAAAQAREAVAQAEAETERAAEVLRELLETLPSPRAGDELLLGYLLADQLPHPHEPEQAEPAIALFTKVANDETANRELRARAAEQRAQTLDAGAEAFEDALEQVLSLTEDPELTIETLIKLADISDDAAKAEALRVRIIELLDQHGDGWQVAHTLASLAEARLERGAFELARDDAARCARESAADFPRDPDPWGCAPVLAEALAELAGAPEGVEVPLAFLGPLAIASMNSALRRHDWNQARHVGMLLLAELPEAAEAPEAIAMLMGLARTQNERAALADKLAHEYGPESEWAEQQRQRLAWSHEPEELERRLAALMEPSPRPVVVQVPLTPAQLSAELRARAEMVGRSCEEVLGTGQRALEVTVDTTGTTPAASVRRGKAAAKTCVRRAAQSCFRSLGPVRVEFGLALE